MTARELYAAARRCWWNRICRYPDCDHLPPVASEREQWAGVVVVLALVLGLALVVALAWAEGGAP